MLIKAGMLPRSMPSGICGTNSAILQALESSASEEPPILITEEEPDKDAIPEQTLLKGLQPRLRRLPPSSGWSKLEPGPCYNFACVG